MRLKFFLFIIAFFVAATSSLAAEISQEEANVAHEKVFTKNKFPLASTCKSCHPKQYREWSVSQHSYSQISPVYMAMQRTLNAEQSGTVGDFCIRCHTPTGMQLGESAYQSNMTRSKISIEGITCVACHRQNKLYGKISGRFPLEEGGLTARIYGPRDDKLLKEVLADPNKYKVVTDPKEQGRKVHAQANKFFEMTTPAFCGQCHDVTAPNGFRLEEAFSEYVHSPAAKRGETCQDCHMGKDPGIASGYDFGPAAKIGTHETKPVKLTNHYFAGPDYPVVHPGLFPHNPEAAEFATPEQWLKFNYKAGWGTDDFEDTVSENAKFPAPWDSIDARYDAREIIEDQLELLAWARKQSYKVLRRGYQLGEFKIKKASPKRVEFAIKVKNPADGHLSPTGFIAERLVFLQVTVKDRNGIIIYRSGDRDPNGDVRDLHSLYVHEGKLPIDKDLFSLQSKFLARANRGGEPEVVIVVNRSPDPRPFNRPSTFSSILTGVPRGARTHRQGIPPAGSRWAKYKINKQQLAGHSGPYKVKVKLIAQMVPVNLVQRIQEVGFDYKMSAREISDKVIKDAYVLQVKEFEIPVKQK